MKVRIDSYAWVAKADLPTLSLQLIKRALTIVPKKFAGAPGPPPATIHLYKETDTHIGMAREYYSKFRRDEHEVTYSLNNSTLPSDLKFNGSLREEQQEALYKSVQAIDGNETGGIIRASAGWGKTTFSCALIAELKVPTLVVVHKDFLMKQWIERINQFLPGASIGQVQGDICDFEGRDIVLGMVQSLSQREYPEALYKWPTLTIFDEIHRVGSDTWSRVPPKFPSRFRLGVSVGPDSIVSVRGDRFGYGSVLPVENLYDAVSDLPSYIEDEYEIINVAALAIESRGFNGKTFEWKKIDKIIRHKPFNGVGYKNIILRGQTLGLTDDHSIFKAVETTDRYCKIECVKTTELNVNDIVPMDNGVLWSSNNEKTIDVASLLHTMPDISKDSISVAVPLDGINMSLITDNPSERWAYKNSGRYGSRLPLNKYMKIRDLLPPATNIYTEGGHGLYVDPYIKLSDYAYLMGFWLGDGWVSDNRLCYAVDLPTLPKFLSETEKHNNNILRPKIRQMTGKSVEVRFSNSLFTKVLTSIVGSTKCFAKRIPSEWLFGWSDEARKQLALGYLDSDGDKKTRITTTSKGLSDDTLVLFRSLGVQCSKHIRKPSTGGVIDGRQVQGKRVGYDTIFGTLDRNIFKTLDRFKYKHGTLSFNEGTVLKITEGSPPEYVYDLEMKGHPSFVANGALVHNTATPRRKDGAENVFFYSIGPIIFSASEQRMKPKIRRVFTDFRLVATPKLNPNLISKPLLLRFLCASTKRNELIITQLIAAVQANRKIIVVSERLKHLKLLEFMLKSSWTGINAPCPTTGQYVGGMEEEDQNESKDCQVMFATSQLVSEGFDLPALDTLFLTTPISDVEQVAGRILRPCEGKKEPIIVDFRDDEVKLCARASGYREAYYEKVK